MDECFYFYLFYIQYVYKCINLTVTLPKRRRIRIQLQHQDDPLGFGMLSGEKSVFIIQIYILNIGLNTTLLIAALNIASLNI